MRGLLLNYQYGMWDAVLNKTKTNTRRGGGLHVINKSPDDYRFVNFESLNGDTITAVFIHKPTGNINRVPVRFKRNQYAYLQEPVLKTTSEIFYKYKDHNGHSESEAFGPLIDAAIKKGNEWNNKYFMAECQARYFVRFTDFKVERLNDISEEDCLLEGIQKQGDSYFYTKDGVKMLFPTAKKAYFSLYNAVNNEKENNNPWLFSYYFTLSQKPE